MFCALKEQAFGTRYGRKADIQAGRPTLSHGEIQTIFLGIYCTGVSPGLTDELATLFPMNLRHCND